MIPGIKEINFPAYATLSNATAALAEMGDRTITTQVKIDGDVVPSFDGWELEFRGERFVLQIKDPQASKDNTTRNSIIDLTFYSWAILQLKRYFMFSVTQTATGVVMADKYEASVNLNLTNFCDLLNKVLEYYFHGKIYVDRNPEVTAPEVFVEMSYSLIWEVMQQIYEWYDVRWRIEYVPATDSYAIRVGYPAKVIDDHDFEYGYDGGLMRFERQVQSDDITNILLGRGGERNVPYRYFKATDPANPEWTADPDAVPELANVYFDRIRDINFRSYVQGWRTNPHGELGAVDSYDANRAAIDWAYEKGHTDEKFDPVEYVKDDESILKYGEHWGHLENDDDDYPTIQGIEIGGGRIDTVIGVSDILTDDIEQSVSGAAEIISIDGVLTQTDSIPAGQRISRSIQGGEFTVPAGYIVNVMDNGWFATGTLVTADTTGCSIDIYEKGSGAKVAGQGLGAGTYFYVLRMSLNNNSGRTVTATYGLNGMYLARMNGTSADEWKPTFDIYVRNLFQTTQRSGESDIEYAERVWQPILGDRIGSEAAVVFSSGFMSISEDYEFKIASYPKVDRSKTLNGFSSEWKITLWKSDAEFDATGLYIPNTTSGGKPVAGDHFFLVGVDMPNMYVTEAERRVNIKKTEALKASSDITPTWVINLDKVRLEDEYNEQREKLFDKIDAGTELRIKDKRFTGGKVLELFANSVTYTWGDGTVILPDTQVVLSDHVVVSKSTLAQVADDVSAVMASMRDLQYESDAMKNSARALYLGKAGAEETSLSPTKFASLVTSKDFQQGAVGGKGWGFYRDNVAQYEDEQPQPQQAKARAIAVPTAEEAPEDSSRSVLEVDKLVVRKEMHVNNLVVNQVAYVGGKQIISAAAIECVQVVSVDGGWDCYFDQKQGTVKNLFKIGDIAFGQVFDAENNLLRYYRCEVTAVGIDYVRLSASKKDGAGIPEKGDVIVQYGHVSEAERQYVIIRDVIGGGYERMLMGLDGVSAEGKEYYFAGRQGSASERWFVGDRNREYAEWKDGILNIKGRLSVMKSDGSYQALSDYISGMEKVTDELQKQIDGAIETWFYSGVPTLTNAPAVNWKTAEQRNVHLGDLYYDENTGKCYRFQMDGDAYVWKEITDTSIQAALDAAYAAQKSASAALSDAQDAQDRLSSWAADGVISPTEKQGIADEIARIDADKTLLTDAYSLYGLGTPTEYNAAYTAYRAQLVALSAKQPETIAIPDTFKTNQDAYYRARTAALYAIDDAAKKAVDAVEKEVSGYSYLKKALAGSTLIEGGLMLTSLIQLGQTENGTFNVYSGINGIMNTAARGSGIAAWYGGDMIDGEVSGFGGRAAQSLFRFDGSGYLAGGNITWNKDGSGSVGAGLVAWNDKGVTLGDGIKLGASEETLGTILTQLAKFNNMFELDEKSVPGKKVIKAKYDGFYTEGFLSSLGINPNAGGTVAGATNLGDLLDVAVSGVTTGQVLTYKGGKWVNADPVAAGMDTTAMWAALGASTSEQIAASHLTSALNGYAKTADVTKTLTVQRNGATVATYNGTATATANISVPTNTNELTNGAGFITSAALTWGNISGKPTTLGGYGITDLYVGGMYSPRNCNDVTYNGINYYNTNGPAVAIGASYSDGALYSQAYGASWVAQIAQDYRNGNLFVRGRNNGTWTDWLPVLTASNVEPYVYKTFGLVSKRAAATSTWGTQVGSAMAYFDGPNGGGIAFRENNPVSGQMSAIIDGYWYQQEGAYRCLDTSDLTSGTIGSHFVKKSGDTMTGALKVPMVNLGNTAITTGTNGGLILINNVDHRVLFQDTFFGPSSNSGTNVIDLGRTNYRWANVYSVLGSFSGQITSTVPTGTAPFSVASKTVVPNLNSDMLDGHHDGEFFRSTISSVVENISSIPGGRSGSYIVTHSGWTGSAYVLYCGSSNSGLAFYRPGGSNSVPELLVALDSTSNWINHGKILTTGQGNAVSATQLKTARTIWGQSFNGTGNVDGTLEIHGPAGSYVEGIRIHPASNGWSTIAFCGAENTETSGTSVNTWSIHNDPTNNFFINRNASSGTTPYILCNVNGNWGVGTAAPTCKLDVNGAINAGNIGIVNTSNAGTSGISLYGGPGYTLYYGMLFTGTNTLGTCGSVTGDWATYFTIDGSTSRGWIFRSPSYGNAASISTGGVLFAKTGIWSNGYVSCLGQNTSSDARLKTILDDVDIPLHAIANMPAKRFRWKANGTKAVGTIAQYWLDYTPEAVPVGPDGYYTAQYGAIALLGLKTVARKVVDVVSTVERHTNEIEHLRRENEQLRREIEQLRAAA